MDGGVLHVPYDMLDVFYDAYVSSVLNGEKVFVVEQKTDVYTFFVDLDYKDESAIYIEDIKEVCQVLCDRVSKHGGKTCLVSVSEPKPYGTLIKSGIHLNWPGFIVNQDAAVALREHILVAMYAFDPSKEWNDIVDVSVYGNADKKTKGSGFRMPWSHKKGKHAACEGRGCASCDKGKDTQLPYLPIFMYRDKTMTQLDPTPCKEILWMSTLRTPEGTPHVVVDPPKRLIKKEGSFTVAQTKNEVHDEDLRRKLQLFIREHMKGQSEARILKLYKDIRSYRIATNSRFCENMDRDHNSNHIWFFIENGTVRQKCFCRCETTKGRKSGMCKDFNGREYILPPDTLKALYPDGYCHIKHASVCQSCTHVAQDDVMPHLEKFIRTHIPSLETAIIQKIVKEKTTYKITTDVCAFTITKNGLIQGLAREYTIPSKLKTILY